MGSRPYSDKSKASQVLMDLIGHISRRGWFSAGPSTTDRDSLLFASFHVPPEDSDRVYGLFTKCIADYSGRTQWDLLRAEQNRFFLCPIEVSKKANALGGFNEALREIGKAAPDFGSAVAEDLVVLCDHIYAESGKRQA